MVPVMVIYGTVDGEGGTLKSGTVDGKLPLMASCTVDSKFLYVNRPC
jgi:hypothetical protein